MLLTQLFAVYVFEEKLQENLNDNKKILSFKMSIF